MCIRYGLIGWSAPPSGVSGREDGAAAVDLVMGG
jgi:hypothetical protein